MRGEWRALTTRAGVADGRKIYTVEESLTGAEQDRRYGDVHLVDQPVAKILLNDVDAAAHSHVLAPAASRARSSATTGPSVTKWKVVPPSMTSGARG